jgi:hypothetical protein
MGKSSANPAQLASRARTSGSALADYPAIDVHPSWVFTTGSAMADVSRGGAVVVVKPRYRSRGLCTCGWVSNPRLLLSSAKVEALIHAARHDCEPAVPLVQPGVMMIVERRRGILDVDGRGGSGQPPQVDQRRGPLPVPRRHASSNRRGRAVPHLTANLLRLIDADCKGTSLQLTDMHLTGNVIASERDCQPHDSAVYREGYSPPRASFRELGEIT